LRWVSHEALYTALTFNLLLLLLLLLLNYLISNLLVDSKLVVEYVQRMLLFPFTDEKKSDVATFPFHLTEIDECGVHSAQTQSTVNGFA